MRGADREAGVSLLEALIGIVLIGMAAAFLIYSSRTSAAGQTRSKVYGDAGAATREVMENIALMPLDTVARLDNTLMTHSQGPGVEVRASARAVQPADVSNFSDLDLATLRHLTLVTRFANKAGGKASKTFTTIVYRP